MSEGSVLVLNDSRAPHLRLLERLPAGTRVVVGDTAEALAGAAADAHVLMVGAVGKPVVEAVWAMAPRLEWVHNMWAGLEGLLFPALVESPVVVTNGRGVFSRSLAEFALTGMLWFAKDVKRMRRQHREQKWEKFTVRELHGATLGVVGHGTIGRAVATLASAFGMRVCSIGRRHTREELAEVLASDYVLIGTPLTAETRGLIGEPELRLMKPESVLINLGRGPVVVEEALVRALREGWIRGAVLDVFDQEPLPAGHALWGLDNVLLSPHCADNTETWLLEATELFLENYGRFSRGEALRNVVDKKAGY